MRHPRALACALLVLAGAQAQAQPAQPTPPPPAAPGTPLDETAAKQFRARKLVERAKSQLERNLVDLAIDTYARALEEYPAYPLAHNELGGVYVAQGDLVRARASFDQAVKLDPSFAVAWANLGEVLRRQKLKDEALEAFRQAIAADPKDAASYYALAALYKGKQQNEEALWALEQYLAVADPQAKELKEAQAVAGVWWKKGLKAKPPAGTTAEPAPPAVAANQAEAPPVAGAAEPGEPGEPGTLASHEGDLAFAEKRYAEALAQYRAELARQDGDLTLFYKIGATHAVLGEYLEAMRWWRRALFLAPERELLRQQIGLAAVQLAKRGHLVLAPAARDTTVEEGRKALLAGDPARALETLRAVKEPEAGYLRGEALLELGLFQEARVEFQALLAQNQGDVDALGGVAEALLRMGGGPEAEQALEAWLGDRSLLAEDFLVLRAQEAATRIAFGPEVAGEFE